LFPEPRHVFLDDAGMTTDYALLMIVGAALAAVLYFVVTSDPVEEALTTLVEEALSFEG
jgi:uncharacterized protein DUF4244